jgi:hypothetical protein
MNEYCRGQSANAALLAPDADTAIRSHNPSKNGVLGHAYPNFHPMFAHTPYPYQSTISAALGHSTSSAIAPGQLTTPAPFHEGMLPPPDELQPIGVLVPPEGMSCIAPNGQVTARSTSLDHPSAIVST